MIAAIVAHVSIGWRRLWLMTAKELRQLLRDRVLLGFIVYGFTLNIFLAGRAISLQLRDARTAIVDEDGSAASRELIAGFREPWFRVLGQLPRASDATRMLDRGDAMVVLHVPPRFEESTIAGRPADVLMQVDATNPGLAVLAAAYGARIVATRAPGATSGEPQVIIDDHRVWFNPNQTDAWATSIIQLLIMITVLSILLPASAMVREKERGTVEQLLVSPLSPAQIIVPKILAMAMVIVAGAAVSLLGLLRLVFHVPARGSLTLLFVVTTIFVFTTSGLGLFLTTIARNLAQVGMLVSAALPPMVFLSGAWSPPEAMPPWLRVVMNLSPLRYYLDIAFGILLKGAGPAALWRPIAALIALGGATLGLGIWRFRRQFG